MHHADRAIAPFYACYSTVIHVRTRSRSPRVTLSPCIGFDGLQQSAKRIWVSFRTRASSRPRSFRQHFCSAFETSSYCALSSGPDSRSRIRRPFTSQSANNLINHRLQFTRSTAKADARILRHWFLSRWANRGRALPVIRRYRCDGSFTCTPQTISNTHAPTITVPSRLLGFFEYKPFATNIQ
jgi:hypothetical protein